MNYRIQPWFQPNDVVGHKDISGTIEQAAYFLEIDKVKFIFRFKNIRYGCVGNLGKSINLDVSVIGLGTVSVMF